MRDFWLMKSKPSVLCLTETWVDKGLPTMRIEGFSLISPYDRADGRQEERSCGVCSG